MPALPPNTPQETRKILSFSVKFEDGTELTVQNTGEGYYREEFFRGGEVKLRTFQAFIAQRVEDEQKEEKVPTQVGFG